MTFHLNQNDTYISKELDPLLTCLHYQVNLQLLNLSSVNFFGKGKLLNYCISQLHKLCELHLQCCDIDAECLMNISHFPSLLRVLDLSYNPLGGCSQEKLYNLLNPLERLQELYLKNCELEEFKYALKCSSLVKLDISWNPIGGDGAVNFLQRHLLTLNLSNTQNSKSNVIDRIFFNDSIVSATYSLILFPKILIIN